MEKYKTDFKLKVVKSFLAGEGGASIQDGFAGRLPRGMPSAPSTSLNATG